MNPADPDTIIRNLAAARRFVEGVLGGADPGAFAELVAESVVVDTGLKPGGKITGRDEYGRVLAATLGAAFSNGRMEIKDIAALVDGRVIVRFEASADNTGAAERDRCDEHALHLLRAAPDALRGRQAGRELGRRAEPADVRNLAGASHGAPSVGRERMKIGIIGAGNIAGAVGVLWARAGHTVRFGTRHPETLGPLLARAGGNATSGSVAEAAGFGEVVFCSVPYGAWPTLAPTLAPLSSERSSSTPPTPIPNATGLSRATP